MIYIVSSDYLYELSKKGGQDVVLGCEKKLNFT